MAEQKCSISKCDQKNPVEWLIKDEAENVIGAYCAPHYAQQKDGIEKNPHLTAQFVDWAKAPAPQAEHKPDGEKKPYAEPKQVPRVEVLGQDRNLPAAQTKAPDKTDLIEYTAFEGTNVVLSVQMFREMICPEANPGQAWYMLQWCAHNRIDMFANEAYFSIISGKPVIQVSKDAWFKRMERHPSFDHHESGILVETTLDHIEANVLIGGDDYLVSEALKDAILQGFSKGDLSDLKKKLPLRFTTKKKSHYLDDKENLLGGWAAIYRKDRRQPYLFTVNKGGWELKTSQGEENVFWKNKAPFMIWKTALKNCTRLAFPELSGLLNAPEAREEIADIADAEFTIQGSNQQKKALFAAGKKVHPPVGPLAYPELHALSVALYEGRGISELPVFDLATLIELVSRAAEGDEQTLNDIGLVLGKVESPRNQVQEDHPLVDVELVAVPQGGAS